jgi:hypothetical protein
MKRTTLIISELIASGYLFYEFLPKLSDVPATQGTDSAVYFCIMGSVIIATFLAVMALYEMVANIFSAQK